MKSKISLLFTVSIISFAVNANDILTKEEQNKPLPSEQYDAAVSYLCGNASIQLDKNSKELREKVKENLISFRVDKLKSAIKNDLNNEESQVLEAFVSRDRDTTETAGHCVVNVRNKFWLLDKKK
ncbi:MULTISPECIES: hypothetical protein [Pectobacterium]|uniref:hypothetical protein n=1 Tax=Pectobacterium TaxID=122277 RepID=UPI00068BC164|nr:hypothetical protein [Pectobacterium odoriferum]